MSPCPPLKNCSHRSSVRNELQSCAKLMSACCDEPVDDGAACSATRDSPRHAKSIEHSHPQGARRATHNELPAQFVSGLTVRHCHHCNELPARAPPRTRRGVTTTQGCDSLPRPHWVDVAWRTALLKDHSASALERRESGRLYPCELALNHFIHFSASTRN